MAKRTFCDGCGKSLEGIANVKRMDVEHTFTNGVTFRAYATFGTDRNSPSNQIIYNDGDLCEDCAKSILEEGLPV